MILLERTFGWINQWKTSQISPVAASPFLPRWAASWFLPCLSRSTFAQQTPTRVRIVNRSADPVPTSVVNRAPNPVPTSIVNPASTPALTSNIDDPGRSAFQSTSSIAGCAGSSECGFAFTVPAQHRLVVQSVSGFLQISGTTTGILARLGTKVAFFASLDAANRISAFVQPMLFYADPGSVSLLLARTNDRPFFVA